MLVDHLATGEVSGRLMDEQPKTAQQVMPQPASNQQPAVAATVPR
jgi:hypothetical protein